MNRLRTKESGEMGGGGQKDYVACRRGTCRRRASVGEAELELSFSLHRDPGWLAPILLVTAGYSVRL